MRRISVALAIAAGIYGVSVAAGSLLYVSGAIGTGATHNDCADFRSVIAAEQGVPKEDVAQDEIKARTEECLAGHELTPEEAFRSEYLFWSLWPAVICAAVFFMWPLWARALERQDMAEVARQESNLEAGT